MPVKSNGWTGAAAALAALATPIGAPGAGQPVRRQAAEPRAAAQWLALSLLYRDDATIVTAPCPPAQEPPGQQAPAQPPAQPAPPTAGEPATPPIGCPPPKAGRRPGIYVGIAVAAAGGIGAAVALGGGKRANSP